MPAPDGDESTIRSSRRSRVRWSMAALASAEPWPSSDRMLQRTKIPLKWCAAPYIVHCNTKLEEYSMADETKVEAQAAAQAPAKVAEVIAETVETIAKESAKVAKRERAATARRAKRQPAAEKTVTPRTARRTRSATRKTRRTAAQDFAAAQKRIETVTNNNFFNGFDAVPAFAPFQTILLTRTSAAKSSQSVARRSPSSSPISPAPMSRRLSRLVVSPAKAPARSARMLLRRAATASSRPLTRSARSPRPSRRLNICSCRASSRVRLSTAPSPRLRS